MGDVNLEHVLRMQKHLRVLSELVSLQNEEFDGAQEILELVVRVIHQEIGYAHFGIGLVTKGGVLRFKAGYGLPPEVAHTLTVQRGQGIAGWVLEHGQAVVIADTDQDPRYRRLVPELRSELCVPLRTRAGVIGVINVESEMVNAFGKHDVELLMTVANGISGLLQRALKQEEQTRARLEKMNLLTPRQKHVLRHLWKGASNQEIAHALKIKVHTVEQHVTQVLEKLELRSRHEAAEWAQANRAFEKNA